MDGVDISSWVETISREVEEEYLLAAKEAYQKLSGPVFQDDKSYEPRMGLFLEWFVLYYQLPNSGKVPLRDFLENKREELDNNEVSDLETMTHSLHGIFQVTHLSDRHTRVHELFEDKEFRVNKTEADFFQQK